MIKVPLVIGFKQQLFLVVRKFYNFSPDQYAQNAWHLPDKNPSIGTLFNRFSAYFPDSNNLLLRLVTKHQDLP